MKGKTKKMRFTFKSFDKQLLDKLMEQLVGHLKTAGFYYSNPVWLPKKIDIEVVLRSPHVNKKSREKFCRITHKTFIDIQSNNQESLVQHLQNFDIPCGTSVNAEIL